jgi:glycosyltransferase 2 family protein
LKYNWKLLFGLLVSGAFMYLAFRRIDLRQMLAAFREAQYWYLVPALALVFLSHWLRAVRWQYLLAPLQVFPLRTLFSSLMIGYLGNGVLPAHLGELIRAYVVGRKSSLSGSAVFGTVVVERLIDLFSVVVVLALALTVYSFPPWVKVSGYVCFGGSVLAGAFLGLLDIYRAPTLRVVALLTRYLPEAMQARIDRMLHAFLDGIVPLKTWKHYVIVFLLTVAIWLCYAYSFEVLFYAFDFFRTYSLPASAALVLLVITTISVIVPSSPGYVGTFHYLCQVSLGLFGVPAGPALTYALVLHGINYLPVMAVGLFCLGVEGVSLGTLWRGAEGSAEGRR